MRYITVETDKLLKTAANIDIARQDYQRLYVDLYQRIDELSAAWNGKDNQAFTNRIKAYQDDFRRISVIMTQYSDFLRNSARAYDSTQEELALEASRLKC